MDPSFTNSPRRKTLDLSRLPSRSTSAPLKDKRFSYDPNQSPLLLSDTNEKLAFIEASLKVLKAENNPLDQTPSYQGLRSLTGSSTTAKSSKLLLKNDARIRRERVLGRSMPPRFQRRHGVQANLQSLVRERKSKQLGWNSIILTVLGLVAVLAVNYWFIQDFQKGVCLRNLTLNMTRLNATIRDRLFGQHLAVDMVPSMVYNHMTPMETKPLVTAFLGWTGVGKNYVSSIIAAHIRTKRRTVREYIVPLHFHHENSHDIYTEYIQEWVVGNFSSCAINLAIIDNLEKASDDVMHGLERLLAKLSQLRLNSTRVIVLLLSSSGGAQINKLLYNHIKNGRERETLDGSDILKSLENSEAQWYLSMQSRGLIDNIVPFLPLEKRHIAQCIEQDIDEKHENCANPHVTATIMEELTFFPSQDPVFSTAGCRKVGTKVDLVIDSIESRHSYYKEGDFKD